MNKLKLKSLFFLIVFTQGCIPLAYTFKEAIPSKIRAQGEAVAHLQMDNAEQARRLADEEAFNEAVFNLMAKIEDMYITPWRRVGTIMRKKPQVKLEVLNLIQQARVRRKKYLSGNKIMVELELDGNKLREVLAFYR